MTEIHMFYGQNTWIMAIVHVFLKTSVLFQCYKCFKLGLFPIVFDQEQG